MADKELKRLSERQACAIAWLPDFIRLTFVPRFRFPPEAVWPGPEEGEEDVLYDIEGFDFFAGSCDETVVVNFRLRNHDDVHLEIPIDARQRRVTLPVTVGESEEHVVSDSLFDWLIPVEEWRGSSDDFPFWVLQ